MGRYPIDASIVIGAGLVAGAWRFWTFQGNEDPVPLVRSIQQGMLNAHIPGAERIASQSLPPAVDHQDGSGLTA
jgi:hypothetical protein